MSDELDQLAINTIRTLSIDAVQQAARLSPKTARAMTPIRGLVAAMLASPDFKGIRRKRLPIFMLGTDHAFAGWKAQPRTTPGRVAKTLGFKRL